MPSNKGVGSGRDDWMSKTGGGKRESSYSREPVRKEGKGCCREGSYRAEKMDKGLPLKK